MITGHWYIILALMLLVLIFYGPGKLPEIGGAVGKAIREFRKSADPVTSNVSEQAAASGAAAEVKGPAIGAAADGVKGLGNGEGRVTGEAGPVAEASKEHSSLSS